MSISELAVVVNDNFTVPLNRQMRDNRFLPARIIESTQDFVVERSGWYKIICVGAGGDSYLTVNTKYTGGAGGVSISTKHLNSGESIQVSFDNGSVSVPQYGMTASVGEDAKISRGGYGGTASGGDDNYTGQNGKKASDASNNNGAGVGVYIPELNIQNIESVTTEDGVETVGLGFNILGYGRSATIASSYGADESTRGGSACIIIPLEYTE